MMCGNLKTIIQCFWILTFIKAPNSKINFSLSNKEKKTCAIIKKWCESDTYKYQCLSWYLSFIRVEIFMHFECNRMTSCWLDTIEHLRITQFCVCLWIKLKFSILWVGRKEAKRVLSAFHFMQVLGVFLISVTVV